MWQSCNYDQRYSEKSFFLFLAIIIYNCFFIAAIIILIFYLL